MVEDKAVTKLRVDIHTHSLRDYFATSLSEKGATIREIQTLLGHSNLTHTERYTLHTDKHLKDAIDLIDKEPEEKHRISEKIPKELQQTPIVIIKVIEKKPWSDYEKVLRSDYFSHFIARNEGQSPVTEIELSLFDGEKRLLEIQKESVLGVKEEFVFKPMIHYSQGSYLLICRYKRLGSMEWNQTWLPFSVHGSSM